MNERARWSYRNEVSQRFCNVDDSEENSAGFLTVRRNACSTFTLSSTTWAKVDNCSKSRRTYPFVRFLGSEQLHVIIKTGDISVYFRRSRTFYFISYSEEVCSLLNSLLYIVFSFFLFFFSLFVTELFNSYIFW